MFSPRRYMASARTWVGDKKISILDTVWEGPDGKRPDNWNNWVSSYNQHISVLEREALHYPIAATSKPAENYPLLSEIFVEFYYTRERPKRFVWVYHPSAGEALYHNNKGLTDLQIRQIYSRRFSEASIVNPEGLIFLPNEFELVELHLPLWHRIRNFFKLKGKHHG